MKLRNQLLALFCLLLFAVFGVFYFRTWVVQKPFGIILFVTDGMITGHLAAARLYEGGADHRLTIESFPHVALLNNSARDFAVPDAASAATALATGTRVNHRNAGVDPDGRRLTTILELAKAQGRSIGLVTSGLLTDPAPAAFYAHLADARDNEQAAAQFTEQVALDVALGGGTADFLPPEKGGRRSDGRDLAAELRHQGRDFVSSKADLENAATFRTNGIVGLFAPTELAFRDNVEAGAQQPSLSDMVRRAIQFLQVNRAGYVLVVDAALVSRAAERNEGERTITETLAFDHALSTALRYAGEKSLILAVGKHATGGLSLNGYPLRLDHGVALIGTTASGHPSLTWATGPKGPSPAASPREAADEPAAFQTPSGLNIAEDVIAAGRGIGAEKLHGFLPNTAIFELLRESL